MPAKYSDHPLFPLRALLIVSATVGILLGFVSATGSTYSYNTGPFVFSCFLLFLSGIAACSDLMSYKVARATDPDHDPNWPHKKYLISDATLACILQWFFWPLVASVTFSSYNSMVVLEAYAALPVFIASIIHGICFWKELMARKKAHWLKSQPLLPCAVCGAFGRRNEPAQNAVRSENDDIEDIRAHCFFEQTPDDTSNESEVLIRTNLDSGYGAIGGEPSRTRTSNKARSSRSKTKRPQ